MIREREMTATPGGLALTIHLAIFVIGIALFAVAVSNEAGPGAVVIALAWAVNIVCMFGLFIVNPNEAKVLQFFGSYVGTVRQPGLKWANPFYLKRKISLRIRNFESNKLKVNEQDGSPIDIAAVVVWRVVDSAEAAFEVENYENFVHVQSESALRNLATRHCYDAHDPTHISLRGNTQEVADQL